MASGHVIRANRPNTWLHRPALHVKKTLASREPSTHGTTRKNERAQSMSASAPKAVIVKLPWHFCDVPIGDISLLFDHLIGAGEDRRRDGEAERFGCLGVDDQLDLRHLRDREIGGLGAA